MAVTKTIEIDGKQVKFKASAAVPRLYRGLNVQTTVEARKNLAKVSGK